MDENLRQRLHIPASRLEDINAVLLDSDMQVMNDLMAVISKYGTPEEINHQAEQARKLPNLLSQVNDSHPAYLKDLEWLQEQRDRKAFISIADYRRKVLGKKAEEVEFKDDFAVQYIKMKNVKLIHLCS